MSVDDIIGPYCRFNRRCRFYGTATNHQYLCVGCWGLVEAYCRLQSTPRNAAGEK